MSRIEQAVIFAGGRGERLRPLTDAIPKPMAPIVGRPFLDYLLQALKDSGIRKVLILVGYKAQVIQERYGNGENADLAIDYSVGTAEDLTGRRLLRAYPQLQDRFLLLYGDNYWPIELGKMQSLYEQKKARCLTTVFANRHGTGEYGPENNIEVGPDGFVRRYDKKRLAPGLNGVDMGFFILDKQVIDPRTTENIFFEETVLPLLAQQQDLVAYVTDVQYYYITNMESLRRFENFVHKQHIQPLVIN